MLNRFSEMHLESWFNKSNRNPLVLRGARQVGKSTLVREFARDRSIRVPLPYCFQGSQQAVTE